MPRGSAVVVFVSLTAATGCFATDKKLPPMPAPAIPPPQQVPDWWKQGGSVCPSLTVAQTNRSAPPGSNLVPGRIVGTPGKRVACMAGSTMHGLSTGWHSSGKVAEHGRFHRNLREGTWTAWHPNGQVASTGEYRAGAQVGVWSYYYPNGRPRERGEVVKGRRRGMWLFWDPDNRGSDPSRWQVYARRSAKGVFRDGKPVRTRPVCIVGLAMPECSVIVLGDLTLRGTLTDQDGGSRSSGHVEPGLLINVARSSAVGLGWAFHFEDELALSSARLRYRHWLAYFVGLDMGAGITFLRERVDGESEHGKLVFLGLSLADMIGFNSELMWHTGPGGREYSVHFGLRIGAPVLLGAGYALLHLK